MTTICYNCKKNIGKNIKIHSLTCHKHVFFCEKCNNIINIQDKCDHDKIHDIVMCKCGEKIENNILFDHLQFCVLSTNKCYFCDIDIKFDDWKMHLSCCHMRTEQCEYCNDHILFSKIQHHKQSCLANIIECKYCKINVLFIEKHEHEKYCSSRTNKCDNCKKYISIKNFNEHVLCCKYK